MQVNTLHQELIEIPLPLSAGPNEGFVSPAVYRRSGRSFKEGGRKSEEGIPTDLHKSISERVESLLEMTVIVIRPASRVSVRKKEIGIAIHTADDGKGVSRVTVGIVTREFDTELVIAYTPKGIFMPKRGKVIDETH